MHLWLNITEIGFKNNIKQSWTFLFLIMDMTNSSEHLLLIATPCDGLFNSLNGHCVFWQDVVINASVFFLGFCIIFTNIWIIWNLFSRSNDEDTSLVILMNLAIADTFTCTTPFTILHSSQCMLNVFYESERLFFAVYHLG